MKSDPLLPGQRSCRKDDTTPAPELLVFMRVVPAPGLSSSLAPAPVSVRFHTSILHCFGVPQFEWKMN